METISLTNLATELLVLARAASNKRFARTLYGGRGRALRQTVIAMCGGERMAEHKSPGEATLQLITGRIELRGLTESWLLTPGDIVEIPDEVHSVEVPEDSVFLLTVVKVEAAQAA
ncbi:LuxR family transcriptional regulator [Leucobacter sp. HY1908]